jgi:hypothetical protein
MRKQGKLARGFALLVVSALGISANNYGKCKTKISTGSRAMRKGNFVIGQRVRLKWELEPPANIPAGAIGEVTRVSPWDVWVRFEKRVVRLPFSEVEQAEFTIRL